MKTFQLDNEPKIEAGFTVPENYFEDFSAKMMQKLSTKEPKTISILSRKKTWFFAAAAIIVVSLSIPFYTELIKQDAAIDDEALENYLTYNTEISDSEIASLLDNQDIQKMNNEIYIEDYSIENELSTNQNLEQYLLN